MELDGSHAGTRMAHFAYSACVPSTESACVTLFLELHEIFIPWTFVRVNAIFRNPLSFSRVESGRAWKFFNQGYLESRDHGGFDEFTICTKIMIAHVQFPVWGWLSDITWCIEQEMVYAYVWCRLPAELCCDDVKDRYTLLAHPRIILKVLSYTCPRDTTTISWRDFLKRVTKTPSW